MYKILLIAVLALNLVQIAEAKTTFKIATLAPDGTSWMKIMREAADNISKKTNGEVRFRFFPSGVMGSDKSVMRKIRIGQLQGGAVSAGALKPASLMTQLYSLPFTFRSLEEVRYVRKKFDPEIKNSLKRRFEVLGMAEGGFAYLMSKEKANTIDILKSQKVWVPEGDRIATNTFQKAGITPISLPISDVYTSLQTGLINTVGVNPTTALALQWHSKLNYVTDFPILFIVGYFIVDKKAFNKLSDKNKKIVKTQMQIAFKKMDKQNEIEEEKAIDAMKNQGIKFLNISNPGKQQWQIYSSQTLKELKNNNEYPQKAYKKMILTLRNYRQKQ